MTTVNDSKKLFIDDHSHWKYSSLMGTARPFIEEINHAFKYKVINKVDLKSSWSGYEISTNTEDAKHNGWLMGLDDGLPRCIIMVEKINHRDQWVDNYTYISPNVIKEQGDRYSLTSIHLNRLIKKIKDREKHTDHLDHEINMMQTKKMARELSTLVVDLDKLMRGRDNTSIGGVALQLLIEKASGKDVIVDGNTAKLYADTLDKLYKINDDIESGLETAQQSIRKPFHFLMTSRYYDGYIIGQAKVVDREDKLDMKDLEILHMKRYVDIQDYEHFESIIPKLTMFKVGYEPNDQNSTKIYDNYFLEGNGWYSQANVFHKDFGILTYGIGEHNNFKMLTTIVTDV
jgi:hypothetical protein